jgi:hypothetical protein
VIERVRASGLTRRRRVIAVAALGLLGVGVLAGCRSEPGTAAFVGGTRITDSQVNDGAKTISVQNVGLGPVRQTYVADLTFIALAEHYARAHKIDLPAVTTQELAQEAEQVNIPAAQATSNPVVRALTQSNKDLGSLLSAMTPATPSDAQLMQIWTRARAAGLTQNSFATDKPTIQQIQGLGQTVALQNEMIKAEKTYNVQVNPKYLPTPIPGTTDNGLEFPVLELQNQQSGGAVTVLGIPLGGTGSSPAVIANATTGDAGTADANTP